MGLFKPAWATKAPPNPGACPQLIFLVATLLTAPPTDRVREGAGGEQGKGGPLGLAEYETGPQAAFTPWLWSCGTSDAFTNTTHPAPTLCMTPLLYLLTTMPADHTPEPIQRLCVLPLPVLSSAAVLPHPQNINQPASTCPDPPFSYLRPLSFTLFKFSQ